MSVFGVFSHFVSLASLSTFSQPDCAGRVRISDEIRVILQIFSKFIKMVLTCRFYEQRYPTLEDTVMVNVRSIADMGAYVHLLEYNNIEGASKVTVECIYNQIS